MSSTIYDPGKFKSRIEIQEFISSEADEFGFSQEEWQTTRKARAYIRNPSMTKLELYKADGYTVINMKEFIFRYNKKDYASNKTRVKYKDKTFEVVKVENIKEENKYFLLLGKLVE